MKSNFLMLLSCLVFVVWAVFAACSQKQSPYGPPRTRHVQVIDVAPLPDGMTSSMCVGGKAYATHARDLDTGQVYFFCGMIGQAGDKVDFFY